MFCLTKDEKKVLCFLLGLWLAGALVNFFLKIYSPHDGFSYFNVQLGKIELNSADKELLMSVPGIGEKIAGRILDYRREKGRFSAVEELRDIKGLSAYRYEKIRSLFYVR